VKYNVRIMDAAKADIGDIYHYIANDLRNPIAAERRISLIEAEIRKLRTNPYIYPIVSDEYLGTKGFRMIVAKSHLVFFIIREELHYVSVIRVLYGRMNWKLMLLNETAIDDA